nr:hypothetical protein [Desulfobulbaceae bacterium]
MKNVLFILIVFGACSFHSQLLAAEFGTDHLFFEHWRHYDSQGIACEACHLGPDNGVYSQPNHKTCEGCHPRGKKNDYDTGQGANCGKCHPKDTSNSSKLLSKVNRSKRSFYHSDQTHSLCNICHGPMLNDAVPLGQLLLSQEMRDIVRRKAHRFHFVDDCKACHNDNRTQKTKPENHDNDWLSKGHAQVAPEFRCRICHTQSSCKDCHEDTY